MESRFPIGVVLASVREGRRGEAFAHWIHALLSERAELTPRLQDLKEWAFPGYAYPWNHKPVAFVSYGGSASGARAVEQLCQVAVELRMVPVRDTVSLPLRGLATDERGWLTDPFPAKRDARMIDELLWWTRITREGRAAHARI